MKSLVLLVATSNPGKVREIVDVLSDLPILLKNLSAFGELPAAEEHADTFTGNAKAKALHYAARTGLLSLADDSGLEVDALSGAPGVHSARFAGPQRDDRANNLKLVDLLRNIPLEKRTARFRCAAVLADPHGILASAEGCIEGVIIDQPRGGNGFGYDPHFLIPSLGKTTAELDPEQKNRMSHRGQALRNLREHIQKLFGDPLRS